jgi:dTDP-glucose 4,6-dehydratase
MSKTVLVTGGAGFIGSCFIRQLLAETSMSVVNLDVLTYAGNPESIPNADPGRYRLIKGDIGNRELVSHLLNEHHPQWIVNFAAESHVDRSIDRPDAFIQTNVVGTFNMLQASLDYFRRLNESQSKAFRFLHVSTDEVYGSLGATGKFVEVTPYAPNSPYSASKAASDHIVRAYKETYGLPVLLTNCSNNYGPYQFPEKLIPLMILNAVEGKPLPVYGDGSNIRDWLFVDDHCRAIRTVLEGGRIGECYNIGGDCERTNLEVVTRICESVDALRPAADGKSRQDLITYVTDRPGHDQRYAIDFSKLNTELGWQPQETFETGLHKTIEWYLSNEPWIESITSGNYRRQRLGLS